MWLLLTVQVAVAAATSLRQQPGPWPNCSHAGLPKQSMYAIKVLDRYAAATLGSQALISMQNGSSAFNFSFNAAWFPSPRSNDLSRDAGGGLIVRAVECNPNHHPCPKAKHPEWSNAGALAAVNASFDQEVPKAGFVGQHSIFWAGVPPPPSSNQSRWGAADPRIRYRPSNGVYYLTWDNCTRNCYPTRSTMLSTTRTPMIHDSWTFHGPLLPGEYTGGAALLFRDEHEQDSEHFVSGKQQQLRVEAHSKHLAFVSDSNTAHAILLAESSDGIHWELASDPAQRTFMEGRRGCWDVSGVAPGPQPERLSTGDYFMVYNIDTGFPWKGNPLGRCAVGWAILDGQDPTRIVARSDGPMLLAQAPWEQCLQETYACQETMVVFSTGMKPLGGDEFMVVYGGGDTDVGIAKVKVEIDSI